MNEITIDGKMPPWTMTETEPKKKVTVRIPIVLHTRTVSRARTRGLTINSLIQVLLWREIGEPEPVDKNFDFNEFGFDEEEAPV